MTSTIDKYIKEILGNNDIYVENIFRHIIGSKGKRLRPMLCLTFAEMLGNVNEKAVQLAACVEIIHQASLLHDDVVDNAEYRHGIKTVNTLLNNKIAVLSGDLILSKVLSYLLKIDKKALELAMNLVTTLAEGELLEQKLLQNVNISEQEYFQIIEKKTASLFAVSAAFGAVSNDLSDKVIDECMHFGRNLGMAFQIKDDVDDIVLKNKKNSDKPRQNDISNGIITLPTIYFLQENENAQSFLLTIFKNQNSKKSSENCNDEIESFHESLIKNKNCINKSENEKRSYLLSSLFSLYRLNNVEFPDLNDFENTLKIFGQELGFQHLTRRISKFPKTLENLYKLLMRLSHKFCVDFFFL